jgi:pheromone shutdown-related protein TraB
LKRTWANLNFWNKLKMAAQLTGSLFVGDDIDEEMIEEIRQEEKLADVLELIAKEFPLVKGTLIDERDTYLSQKIRNAPGDSIVAIVGAGHVPGILKELHEEKPLEPLMEIPEPSLWPKLLKWGIPAAIIALLAYGFLTGDSEKSLQSIYIWILVNGALSALGAALALGHPLTVLSAFLAAPLTSLNPLIAAGWVCGLVQALLRKPTVKDLEDLPEAITSVRGFWMNPVSRILLVVVLSNLGSTLGTFISGSWIAARTIG